MPLPYPLLSDILNGTRARINDAIQSLGGQTLTNINDFTPVYTNIGFRKMQQYFVSLGYPRFIKENFNILDIPAVATLDTSTQAYLDWSGYFDGQTLQGGVHFLPPDLIKPMRIAERSTINPPPPFGNESAFIDIDFPVSQIPSIPKKQWMQIAVWRDDKLYMPGATVNTDLTIDYAAYLPDFLPNTTALPNQFPGTQTVNILRCENALECFIAYVFSDARGNPDAASFLQEAQDECMIIAGVKKPEGMTV